MSDQLKPFVEKKIVEYLGVQEQMLVDVVEEHIRKRASPQELVEELEGVSLPSLSPKNVSHSELCLLMHLKAS